MRWWALGGLVTGFAISDLWPSWWNLTLVAAFLVLAVILRRCGG